MYRFPAQKVNRPVSTIPVFVPMLRLRRAEPEETALPQPALFMNRLAKTHPIIPRFILNGFALALVLAALLTPVKTYGRQVQPAPRGPNLQLGLGLAPGAGLQLGYISAGGFYTREAIFNVDVSPSFWGGDGNIQFSAGFGGAIRILGIGRTIGNTRYNGYDIDVGMRVGPGLLFAFKETLSSKNQRFNLFLAPFTRLVKTLKGGRVLFAEIVIHRPVFRFGFWIPFR